MLMMISKGPLEIYAYGGWCSISLFSSLSYAHPHSPIARFTGVSLYDLDDDAKVVKQVTTNTTMTYI